MTRLALSPHGGPFLVTACDDSSLRVWKLASGQQTCEATPIATDQLRFMTFSPDGAWLVVAGADRDASPRSGQGLLRSRRRGSSLSRNSSSRHDAPINMVVFNPRGDRFVTLTGDSEADPGEAKIWDRSGNCIELKGDEGSRASSRDHQRRLQQRRPARGDHELRQHGTGLEGE